VHDMVSSPCHIHPESLLATSSARRLAQAPIKVLRGPGLANALRTRTLLTGRSRIGGREFLDLWNRILGTNNSGLPIHRRRSHISMRKPLYYPLDR
jgi:hypothetical protein